MSQSTDQRDPSAGTEPSPVENRVCPFCGSINEVQESPCPRCGMEDSATTRQATKARIGPWYVLQSRNPAAPGMRFSTLLALVKRGQVTAHAVVRGPTTHQLWQFAGDVKGLSREFGLCWSCGEKIETSASLCPHCQRMQEPPAYPDMLLDGGAPPSPPRAAKPSEPAPRQPEPQAPRSDIFDAPAEPPPAPKRPAPAPVPAAVRGGEILSAKELATAFQINFAPDDGSKAHPGPKPKRRRSYAKFAAAALLLLTAGAAAGALYLRPDWREQSLTWAVDSYRDLRDRMKNEPASELESDLPDMLKTTPDDRVPDEAPDAVVARSADPDGADAALPPVRAAPAPATAEARTVAQAPVQQAPVVAPPPVAKTPEPAPAPEMEVRRPVPADPAAQLEKARLLWHSAIDAEGRREFTEAVRLYQQIQDLPRDVWPGGLELRLANARKRM